MTMGDQITSHVSCPSCQQQNEPDMAFCLYCGQPLGGAAAAERERPRSQTAGGTGTLCPRCGKYDELNARFCVYCGADTSTSTRPSQTSYTNWELARETQDVPVPLMTLKKEISAARKPPFIVTATAIVLGAAIGFGMTIIAAPIFANASTAKLTNQSLNIFANEPFAQVTVVPFPSEDARVIVLGQLSQDGSLSVPGLAPGRYLVTVEKQGFRRQLFGVLSPIVIEPSKATLLGVPRKIDLPPRHTDQDPT